MPLIRVLVLAFLLSCFLATFAQAQLPWENSPRDGAGDISRNSPGPAGGGLLESILFGARFTGFTTMDFAVMGLVASVGAFAFLRSRSSHEDEQNPQGGQGSGKAADDDVPGPGRDSEAYRRSQQTWDYLSSKPKQQDSSRQQPGQRPQAPPPAPDNSTQQTAKFDLGHDLAKDLPQTPTSEQAGFDTNDLLQGAKVVYARLHESIAESDWDDVQHFTTPEFYKQLQSRVAEKRRPPMVLFVEAGVENTANENGRHTADVVFASLMQFDENQPPQEIREAWRFEKGPDTGDSWRVSSMQRKK